MWNISQNIFLFKRIDDELIVESKINFEIKKLGVVLYSYNVEGTERYKDGQLVQFNSKTNQNRKKKYVNIKKVINIIKILLNLAVKLIFILK